MFSSSASLNAELGIVLRWGVVGSTIHFEVDANNDGNWFGIGFNSRIGMIGADIVTWDPVTKTITDRHATRHIEPAADAVQDYTLVSHKVDGVKTTIRFSRPVILAPKGGTDMALDKNIPIAVLWAMGDNPALAYHGIRRGGSLIVINTDDAEPACFFNGCLPNFAGVEVSGTAPSVIHAAAGDMDGDGSPDVVAALKGSDRIVWYGSNSRDEWTEYVIDDDAPLVNDVVVIDLNRDGLMDVVSVHKEAHSVVNYLQQPNGKFLRVVIEDNLFRAHKVAVDDVSGDGLWDIVAVGSKQVAVYRQLSTGNFERQVIHSISSGLVVSILLVDIDSDRVLDIVVTSNEGKVLIFLNRGIGFTLSQLPKPFLKGRTTAAADMNGDGRMDIITQSYSSFGIWTQDLSGDFTFAQVTSGEENIGEIIPADINGDGHMDAVVSSMDGASKGVHWYRGNSQGVFEKRLISTGLSARGLSVLDMDGDGDLDVVVAMQKENSIVVYYGQCCQPDNVFPTTDGPFDPTTDDGRLATRDPEVDPTTGGTESTPAPSTAEMSTPPDTTVEPTTDDSCSVSGCVPTFEKYVITSLADNIAAMMEVDFDGDGDLDLITASTGDNTVEWHEQVSKGLFVLNPIDTGITDVLALTVGDVDNDGNLDIIVSQSTSDTKRKKGALIVYTSNKARTKFTKKTVNSKTKATWLAIADMNQDGTDDIVAVSAEQRYGYWFDSEDNFERYRITGKLPGITDTGAVSDMNEDGYPDLIVSHTETEGEWKVEVYVNGGETVPVFVPIVIGKTTSKAADFYVGDVNFDRDADVVILSVSGTIFQFASNGQNVATKKLSQVFDLTSFVVGPKDSVKMSIADQNGDGYYDIAVMAARGKVTLYLSNGNGSFKRETLYKHGDGGVGVIFADVDGDGDLDVISASAGDVAIRVHDNQCCGEAIDTLDPTLQCTTDWQVIAESEDPSESSVNPASGVWQERTDGLFVGDNYLSNEGSSSKSIEVVVPMEIFPTGYYIFWASYVPGSDRSKEVS